MDKTIVLVVAGVGKTYYICHNIDPTKRSLILAFTYESINSIQEEFYAVHGCVPELTTIAIFDSFIYHHFILPCEPSIAQYFGAPGFVSHGICTVDPPPMHIPVRDGRIVSNPHYLKKGNLAYYITERSQYYCATLSELVLQVKHNRESLVRRVATRLNLSFNCILIDGFQGFREYDYELILTLANQLQDMTLVGDYHRHSASITNNSGKLSKRRTNDVSYDELIAELKDTGFKVDLTTLGESRRYSSETCQYIREKLGINISSHGNNIGSVIWADEDAAAILGDQQAIKLLYKDAAGYSFCAINRSYSKGDTTDTAYVILTDNFEKLAGDEFPTKGISGPAMSKLYIAMTRSCGNLYLMRSSTFKEIRDEYVKNKSLRYSKCSP